MGEERPLHLEEILEFAYCPVRYWLSQGHCASARETVQGKTGEQLVRAAVRQALFVFQKYEAAHELTFSRALELVWSTWLKRWSLSDIAGQLAEYDALVFTQRKRPDGTTASGAEKETLRSLLSAIDAHAERAGLMAGAGLAEAYARTLEIARNASLPEAGRVLGVSVPLTLELLSCELLVTADLVVDYGEEALPGRPKQGEKPRTRQVCVVELHLYEEALPQPEDLARDVRILALGQARMRGTPSGEESVRIDAVLVRHMRSGTFQTFHPKAGDGLDALEALATSVEGSIRAGAFLPRMVCGPSACGPCPYRPVCFAPPGILLASNPPLSAQIEAGQALYTGLSAVCQSTRSAPEALAAFFQFWEAHPHMTARGAQQMMRSIQGE